MIYNDEQFNALSQYEGIFDTAIRMRYARNPGRGALDTIRDIHLAATGHRLSGGSSCQTCILNTLRTVGKAWLADKQERIDKQNAARFVELTEEAAAKRQTAVTTKKPGTPRKSKKNG